MDNAAVVLGARLRDARTAAGLSLGTVAARTGMPRSTIADLEKGSAVLTVGRLRGYAAAIGCSAFALVPELVWYDAKYIAPPRTIELGDFAVVELLALTDIAGRSVVLRGWLE